MRPEEVDRLVLSLRSESSRTVEHAERRLEELKASDIAALIDRSNSIDRANEATTGCGFLLTALMLPFGVLLRTPRFQSTGFEVEEAALERIQDPQGVGPILRHLEGAKQPMRGHFLRALRRLLPMLTSEDSPVMTQEETAVLNRIVSANAAKYDPAFLVTVIEALAKVGNSASLDAIRALSHRPPNIRAKDLVVAAATTSGPILEQRLAEIEESQSLLRASAVVPDDTLVRPTGSPSDSDPSHLLRPVNPSPESSPSEIDHG